jgi:hypothetical protein
MIIEDFINLLLLLDRNGILVTSAPRGNKIGSKSKNPKDQNSDTYQKLI